MSAKIKIAMVNSNTRWGGKRPWMCAPYPILILTALLKDHFDLALVDANADNLTPEETEARLRDIDPGAVLITTGSVEYYMQTSLATALSRRACPQAQIVVGGVYATTMPEELARDENADWVFMYHAEERIAPFLNIVLAGNLDGARNFPGVAWRDEQGNVQVIPCQKRIGDVLKMVQPDYSLVNLRPYLDQQYHGHKFKSGRPTAFLVTSYGCPNQCVFCASRTISGRKIAFRPLEDVFAEIDFLVQKHGVRHLILMDDALMINRTRISSFCRFLIDRKYDLTWVSANASAWSLDEELLNLIKTSGCSRLTISVESGSERVMKEIIRKPLKLEIVPNVVRMCRKLGIGVTANFIIGLPGETYDEILDTINFAETCDFDLSNFNIATPLPKTDLYELCKKWNALPEDFSFLDERSFGFARGVIETSDFTPRELEALRTFEWDRLNFNTLEKRQRVADMFDISLAELHEHRKTNRRAFGIHY